MIAHRDAKIAARFVFWTEVQRLRTDDAIRYIAKNEFFISEQRIIEIIKQAARDNGDRRRYVFPHPRLPKFSQKDMELFPD